MKVEIKTLDNATAGNLDIADAVFGAEVRVDILHRMVNYQLAKRRAGTHKVKTRGEVVGSTAKQGNQKGGGRARRGNGKVPQFRGGGRAFGPVVRDHAHKLPKKVRALAMRSALSSKVNSGKLIILDQIMMDAPKTQALQAKFAALGVTNALIVGGAELDLNFARAANNILNIDVLPVQGANVYDILRRDQLILTKEAVESLEGRLS